MEKERKLDAIIGLYPFQQQLKICDDGLSVDKSSKTNPLFSTCMKVKTHSRTQSDAIIKNPKLLHKFIEDARLLNFIEHNQNKVMDNKQLIKKSSSKSLIDSLAFKNRFKQSFSAKKSRKNVLTKHEAESNGELQENILNGGFETIHKTDIDNTITRADVVDFKSSDNNISTDFQFNSPMFVKSSNLNDKFGTQAERITPESTNEKVKLLCTINAHLDSINRLEVVDDNRIATFSHDSSVKLWNVKGAKNLPLISELQTLRYHYGPVLSSAATRGFIFSGDSKGYINVFKNAQAGYEHFRTFKSGPEPVWSMSFNSSSQLLASSTPSKLKIWDLNQVSPKTDHCALNTNSRFLGDCSWYSNSSVVVYSYDNTYEHNEFIFLDTHKNQEKHRVAHPTTFSNRFLVKQENLLISANENHTVSMFDLRTHKIVQEFVAHSNNVSAIEFDESKGMLMTGSSDSSLRLWDIRYLRCLQEFTLHKAKYDDSIFDIRFCSDLSLIMTGGADATIRFFQTP